MLRSILRFFIRGSFEANLLTGPLRSEDFTTCEDGSAPSRSPKTPGPQQEGGPREKVRSEVLVHLQDPLAAADRGGRVGEVVERELRGDLWVSRLRRSMPRGSPAEAEVPRVERLPPELP